MATYKDVDEVIRRIEGNTLDSWGEKINSCLWSHSVEVKNKILKLLRDAPAADVAPVMHGEWVSAEGDETPCDEWDCTACGERRTFVYEMDEDEMNELYQYCPNCGAKMDGGKHETD